MCKKMNRGYMTLLKFHVEGDPLPKERPRHVTRGGKSWTITPKRTLEWESKIKESVIPKMLHMQKFEDKIGIRLHFRRATKRKCDIDNLVKAVLDALNNVVWQDDSQIESVYMTLTRGVKDCGVEICVGDTSEWLDDLVENLHKF